MAKAIKVVSLYRKKSKVSRPGKHSKKRSSKLKTSKHYVKLSRGQG
jgi:hypothetical protein